MERYPKIPTEVLQSYKPLREDYSHRFSPKFTYHHNIETYIYLQDLNNITESVYTLSVPRHVI